MALSLPSLLITPLLAAAGGIKSLGGEWRGIATSTFTIVDGIITAAEEERLVSWRRIARVTVSGTTARQSSIPRTFSSFL